MARSKAASREFALIARHFAPLATHRAALALRDDAALLVPEKGHSLVITKDAIAEGVHFLASDPMDLVARKLLRVNVSDLAAKGAKPLGYFLATAFPDGTTDQAVAMFCKGLKADQKTYGLSLLGGDTIRTFGPAVFSCTMIGTVAGRRFVSRNGAKPGDDLWVTGTLGDSGQGLALLQQRATAPEKAASALMRRYWLPSPPFSFHAHLAGLAHAALDVSDGLLQDAGHLAELGGVQLAVRLEAIPLSSAFVKSAGRSNAAKLTAATSGDDYQILFSA
ncbi:MAG TPA: thiamine-phosphate kinase, partial [Alphaproteobacteria bacterium]|nr:thiamine-phosphate kinase [Alphaproteobacteria bacterium]